MTSDLAPGGGSRLPATTLHTIVTLLLCALTFTIYFQVRDHDFIEYDDPIYITENANLAAGFSRRSWFQQANSRPRIFRSLRDQLDPTDLDFVPLRSRTLRPGPRGLPPRQRSSPYDLSGSALFRTIRNDTCTRSECIRRGRLRSAPTARGERCLGRRAQGYAERSVLDAHTARLRSLRRQAFTHRPAHRPPRIRARIAREADARFAAPGVVATRLLAVAAARYRRFWRNRLETPARLHCGETAAVRDRGGGGVDHDRRSGRCRSNGKRCADSALAANQQRTGDLLDLHRR